MRKSKSIQKLICFSNSTFGILIHISQPVKRVLAAVFGNNYVCSNSTKIIFFCEFHPNVCVLVSSFLKMNICLCSIHQIFLYEARVLKVFQQNTLNNKIFSSPFLTIVNYVAFTVERAFETAVEIQLIFSCPTTRIYLCNPANCTRVTNTLSKIHIFFHPL